MNRAIRNKTDEYFCHGKSNKNAMLSFAVYMVLKTHIKSEKNLKKYLAIKTEKKMRFSLMSQEDLFMEMLQIGKQKMKISSKIYEAISCWKVLLLFFVTCCVPL